MITGGFFAILDDITLLLDDAASATKMAVNKTVGILGDDLAVNAEKAAKDFSASRELPVIWKITKGSILNKLILLPIISFLSYYFPYLINPILFIGALYLAFEGSEKVLLYLMDVQHEENKKRMTEKDKVKSAIFTDFILSIEIILITLSSVSNKPFLIKIIVLTIVSILATIFVYGIVAIIVRLDDTGYAMIRLSNQIKEKHIELNRTMKTIVNTLYGIGKSFVLSMPMVIKVLTIVGTIAMLMVSGGIITHIYIRNFKNK